MILVLVMILVVVVLVVLVRDGCGGDVVGMWWRSGCRYRLCLCRPVVLVVVAIEEGTNLAPIVKTRGRRRRRDHKESGKLMAKIRPARFLFIQTFDVVHFHKTNRLKLSTVTNET